MQRPEMDFLDPQKKAHMSKKTLANYIFIENTVPTNG